MAMFPTVVVKLGEFSSTLPVESDLYRGIDQKRSLRKCAIVARILA